MVVPRCIYVPAAEGKEAMPKPVLGSIILGQDTVGCIGESQHANRVLYIMRA